MNKNYFHIIVLIFLFSCKEQSDEVERVTLSEADRLVLPINNRIKNFHQQLNTYFLHGKECVYFVENDRIIFIDIESKKIAKEIFFEKEGPNGIHELQSAYIHQLDSIIIKGFNPYLIYVADSTGKITKKIPFPENTEISIRGSYFVGNNKPTFVKDRIIGFLHPTLRSSARMMEFNTSPFFEILKKEAKVNLVNTKFPDFFWKDRQRWQFHHFIPGITFNNDKMVVSYPACDSIFTMTFGKEVIVNKYYAKSKFKKKESYPIPPNATDIKEVYQSESDNFEYRYIVYDGYRNVYYRFLLHPVEYDVNRYNAQKTLLSKSFSIQVLDENFKTIGYQEFQSNKFCVMDYFVGKDGLYLSTNNPENPETDENFLKYSLLKLVKK